MNNDFKHILVPIDFTEKNRSAITAASKLATQSGSTISLLHVIERIDLYEDDEVAKFYEKLRHRAEEEFKNLIDLLDAERIDVRAEAVIERRVKGILSYAVDNNVDLIVMSSHRVDTTSTGPWVTISYQVSALCPCSIMLVK